MGPHMCMKRKYSWRQSSYNDDVLTVEIIQHCMRSNDHLECWVCKDIDGSRHDLLQGTTKNSPLQRAKPSYCT